MASVSPIMTDEEMDAVQRELDEYEREIKRRLWRRRFKVAFDVLAEVAFVALLLATAAGTLLWCAALIFRTTEYA